MPDFAPYTPLTAADAVTVPAAPVAPATPATPVAAPVAVERAVVAPTAENAAVTYAAVAREVSALLPAATAAATSVPGAAGRDLEAVLVGAAPVVAAVQGAPDLPTAVVAGTNALVAEAGSSTSEWKFLIGTAVQNAVALAVAFGAPLTAVQQQLLVGEASSATALAIAWIIGRSIRKHGTTA